MEFIDNLEGFKNNGVVLTVGFFDGVHVGHRFLIDQLAEIAKAEGLQSAVLTFWPHPRIVLNEDYKPKLLNSYEEKFELMKALPIDFCIRTEFSEAFSNYQAYDFMKLLKEKLNVKHLLVGYDHRFGKNREEGFDDYCVHGEALGIKVTQAQPLEEDGGMVSSSYIRDLLGVGEVALASKCLGYEYKIHGKVVCGQKKGREIGFPTANVSLSCPDKCLPKKGVYAAVVVCGDVSCNAMLYIGNRPTVNSDGDLSVEAHLIGFDGDLYGKDIEISVISRIREQRKFNSMEDLKDQIVKDCEAAKDIFCKK
mgnify:CR=1 FL=1